MTNKPTREQILALPPGRELDMLIAEYVFGFDVSSDIEGSLHLKGQCKPLPNYSTCWGYFEHVVQEMEHKGYDISMYTPAFTRQYKVSFGLHRWDEPSDSKHVSSKEGFQHAGCQAALLAVLEV